MQQSPFQILLAEGGHGECCLAELHAVGQCLEGVLTVAQLVVVEQKPEAVVSVAAHREGVGALGAVGHGVGLAAIDHHVDVAGVADPPGDEADPALCRARLWVF